MKIRWGEETQSTPPPPEIILDNLALAPHFGFEI